MSVFDLLALKLKSLLTLSTDSGGNIIRNNFLNVLICLHLARLVIKPRLLAVHSNCLFQFDLSSETVNVSRINRSVG